jgi:adenylate cyclase
MISVVPREIERKFLVANDGWRNQVGEGRQLRQAYIAFAAKAVVRVRIEDESRAWLTIKSAGPGLTRQEFEYDIPPDHAEALFALREGSAVEKTRFSLVHAGQSWQIDIYSGDNAGLVIAEIELATEDAAIEVPPWAGAEVTADQRYYAASLARYPSRFWAGSNAGR